MGGPEVLASFSNRLVQRPRFFFFLRLYVAMFLTALDTLTFEKSLAKKRREKRRIVEATVLAVCHTAAIPIPIVKALHEDDQTI